MVFLNQELQLIERMVLDSKTAKLMGVDYETKKCHKDTKPQKWSEGVHYGTMNDLKCHFCDEDPILCA